MEKDNIGLQGYIRLSVVLSTLHRNLERIKTSRVRPLGLKYGEVLMVYMLNRARDGLTAEQLSRACDLDRSLISRGVKSLKQKGLLDYPEPEKGKRPYGVRLKLTAKGREAGQTLTRFAREIGDTLDESISRFELQSMYTTLLKLIRVFERLNRPVSAGKKRAAVPSGGE